MSTRTNFVKIAASQVGMFGGDKYRKWYNKNVCNIGSYDWAWCAAGISWCASQAGMDKAALIPTASAPVMLHNFQNSSRFKKRGEYTPQGGDIIIFKYSYNKTSDASHVGIVERVEKNYVHTIEFNSGSSSDGAVAKWKYQLTSPIIVGYGIPRFDSILKTVTAGRIRKNPWRDPFGGSSKTLALLPKETEIEYIEDDGWGWGKVRLGNVVGFIQNNRLDSTELSRYHMATVTENLRVRSIAANEKITLSKGDRVKFICSIDKGKNKDTAVISKNGVTYTMPCEKLNID